MDSFPMDPAENDSFTTSGVLSAGWVKLKGLLKKCLTHFNRREEVIVRIPPLAGWLSALELGQGQACPYTKTSP
jgi:hypothetical protein